MVLKVLVLGGFNPYFDRTMQTDFEILVTFRNGYENELKIEIWQGTGPLEALKAAMDHHPTKHCELWVDPRYNRKS